MFGCMGPAGEQVTVSVTDTGGAVIGAAIRSVSLELRERV
jgi:hypothetical protein